MAYTAQEPLDEAKGLLNDVSGHIYTDARMLPLLQKAYRELQIKMQLNGLATLKEVSTVIDVAAGVVALGDGSGLPTDFISPIALEERADNSTELFQDMFERDWEPTQEQSQTLGVWVFREEEIKFLGATTPREVRIKYQKGLTRITAVGTAIGIIGATGYLASRAAAIAAIVIGENESRAGALNGDAGMQLDDLLRILVKRRQGLPVRRKVNRYRK